MKRFLLLPLWALVLTLGLVSCNDDDDIKVIFTDLTANGSETERTTVLTLEFDSDFGLIADDITITDTDGTGVEKGELTDVGDGVYELKVGGITAEGTINVAISKEGYEITPASIDVAVYTVDPINLDDFVGTMSLDDPFYKRDVYDVISSKTSDTELEITDFFVKGKKIRIVVDLNAHTVTIPRQILFPVYGPYTNFFVEGLGTIDGVNKVIRFEAECAVDQGGWGTFEFVLTHKPDGPSK